MDENNRSTQDIQPGNRQVVAPSFVSVDGPQQMPKGKPESTKAPEPLKQALQSDEASNRDPWTFTVPQLKQEAKRTGITGYSQMNKKELIETIYNLKEE